MLMHPLEGYVLVGAPPASPYMVADTRPKVLQARTQCAFPAALHQGLQNALKPLTLSQAHLALSLFALVHTKLRKLRRLLRSCLGSHAETHQEYHWLLPSPWLVAGIMSDLPLLFLQNGEYERTFGQQLKCWVSVSCKCLWPLKNLPPTTPKVI